MSRPRKADHATAIEAAQGVFWRNGYVGTSTRQIEECSGVTRFTLQTSYGGKQAFFLETLDAYLDKAEAHHLPDPATTDLEGLAIWFEQLSDAARLPEIGDKGCLLLNAISEFERDGGEVDQRIERYFTLLQSRFTQILTNAVDRKENMAGLDPQGKAKVLVSLLLGVSLVNQARTNDTIADSYASAAAAMIREWKS
jgi:TetR/AcrR family transcriptional repressor of nem operon